MLEKKSESWNIENQSFTLNASKKSENWNIEILLKVAWILNIRFWHWMLQTEWTLEYWNKGCVNIEYKSLTLNASKKSENWNIEIRLRPCSNFLPCVCLPLLAYRITGQETFRPAGNSRGTKCNIRKFWKYWEVSGWRSMFPKFKVPKLIIEVKKAFGLFIGKDILASLDESGRRGQWNKHKDNFSGRCMDAPNIESGWRGNGEMRICASDQSIW